MTSCYEPERNCTEFKDGKFAFTTTIGDEEKTTIFLRKGDLEIDYFDGKADSSSVRWINDCEYIVKKLDPKNKSEEQSVHMKILSTTADSYIFEYNIVGESKHDRGTAIRTK
ncbi:DNA topoisomerase IV [Zobellia nedashkovskayae]